MSITAKEVNALRQKTGAGLMDCKKALVEANGDMEAAVDYLRKKGQKVAELRAGRDANEGAVIAKSNADNNEGVIVHLSCETDFVAKNEDFINFATRIADVALNEKIGSLEDLLQAKLDGISIQDLVTDQVGKIGENISVANFRREEGALVVPYIHAGNKIGVLVNLSESSNGDIGRDVAMQIAAMNPVAVDETGVPSDIVEREMAIGREQATAEGKPEQMIDKIAEGKVKKFFKENTLLNQQFVKDGKKTVKQALTEVSPDLTVTSFKRVALGD